MSNKYSTPTGGHIYIGPTNILLLQGTHIYRTNKYSTPTGGHIYIGPTNILLLQGTYIYRTNKYSTPTGGHYVSKGSIQNSCLSVSFHLWTSFFGQNQN